MVLSLQINSDGNRLPTTLRQLTGLAFSLEIVPYRVGILPRVLLRLERYPLNGPQNITLPTWTVENELKFTGGENLRHFCIGRRH